MGQFAKLNKMDVSSDMLLDEDFDQYSLDEEWSMATSNILEFKSKSHNATKRIVYEF